ncbi:MAG: helix-turn-helix transcriptional regulator [Gammaproteobacteria bacterium]|nr:helix-turn-helix transcriptional regulator [Gammaproteobacteria bacterium]
MGTTKQALIEQITEVFRLHGFAGATLAQLSAATGLKRASLYHHFPGGKADMANEALIAALTEMNDLALTRLAGPQGASLRLDGFIEGFPLRPGSAGAGASSSRWR